MRKQISCSSAQKEITLSPNIGYRCTDILLFGCTVSKSMNRLFSRKVVKEILDISLQNECMVFSGITLYRTSKTWDQDQKAMLALA